MTKTTFAVGDTILQQYKVEKVLHGGMAYVYIVYDKIYHERYAVKTPLDEKLLNPDVLQRFIRESKIWMNLDDYPNIVKAMYIEKLSTNNMPLLFLEYIEGTNLRNFLAQRKQKLHILQLIDFSLQICNALQYAYEKVNLIHRDLKPENVLITPEGLLKVTDFGLSKAFFDEPIYPEKENTVHTWNDFTLSQDGAIFGTFPYMSLEQLNGVKHIGVETDVYSFGVLLYEMLTGRLPFIPKLSANTLKVDREAYLRNAFVNVQLKKRPPIPSLKLKQTNISKELDIIVMKCLENLPENRFSDFARIKNSLIEIYDSLYEQTGKHMPSWERETLRSASYTIDKGDYKKAIELCDIVLSKNSRNAVAYLIKANSLVDMAQFENAQQYTPFQDEIKNQEIFSKQLQQCQSAIRCCERGIEFNPLFDEIWNTKANSLLLMGRFQRALECFDKAVSINPNYGAAWFNRGTCLRRLDRFDEALKSCERAIKINPQHANAWYGKGMALALLKDYNEAIICLDKALEINPNHNSALSYRKVWVKLAEGKKDFVITSLPPYARDLHKHFQKEFETLGTDTEGVNVPQDQTIRELINRALGLKNLSKFDEALKTIEKAIELNSESSEAWLRKGQIQRNMRNYEQSIDSFDKALKISKDSYLALLNKGLVLMDMSCHEDALLIFDKCTTVYPDEEDAWLNKGAVLQQINRLDDSQQCFDTVLKINPNYANAWSNKASIHLLQNNIEEALNSCEKSLEIDINNYKVWMQKGIILKNQKKYHEAFTCFDRVSKLNPKSPFGWLEMANCLVLLRINPDLIINCCKKVMQLGEIENEVININLMLNIGRSLYEQKKYNTAIKIFDELFSYKFKDKNFEKKMKHCAWVQKATCLVQIDQWKDAADCYANALTMEPGTPDLVEGARKCFQIGYPDVVNELNRGFNILQSGNYGEALKIFQKVIEECPNYWEIWEKIGIAYMLIGTYEKAIMFFNNYLEINPNSAEIWNLLATCFLNSGKLDDAMEALNKSLAINPNLTQACYTKGCILSMLGKYDESLIYYKRALELNPNYLTQIGIYFLKNTKTKDQVRQLIASIPFIAEPQFLSTMEQEIYSKKQVEFQKPIDWLRQIVKEQRL